MEIKLNRIILFGKEINGLKIFYQRFFHFKLVEEIENEWVVLNAGNIELAFHKIGKAFDTNESATFRVNSNSKLVFEIGDKDLVDFREKLLQGNVLIKDLKSFGGSDFLVCDGEDFEGNVFQLKQTKPV